jgi:GGDEF domain-containing protein
LRASASQVFDPGGQPLRGTAAWALFPADGGDAQAVVRKADRRLYAAKRGEDPGPPPPEGSPVARALSELA